MHIACLCVALLTMHIACLCVALLTMHIACLCVALLTMHIACLCVALLTMHIAWLCVALLTMHIACLCFALLLRMLIACLCVSPAHNAHCMPVLCRFAAQNTHKEPLEVVQMDATKRKPITDPDRPTVSVRLFDNTRREVVLDLPPKKLEVPKQVTSYDPEKFKTGTE